MNKGFTLSEVLITLGIIGIIAAMTLPALISNHNKKVIETRLEAFYSIMNQGILLSESDNGDKKYWLEAYLKTYCSSQYSESCLRHFYNIYLKKYVKITNTEYILDSDNKNVGMLLLYFANGSGAKMGYSGRDYLFFPNAAKMKKNNNQDGKDYFRFGLYPAGADGKRRTEFLNKGVEPYITSDWDGTREGLRKNKQNYTKLIQLNNWKIPDDYPIKL